MKNGKKKELGHDWVWSYEVKEGIKQANTTSWVLFDENNYKWQVCKEAKTAKSKQYRLRQYNSGCQITNF